MARTGARTLLAAVAFAGGSLIASLATYSDWVDGPFATFLLAALLGLAAWGLVLTWCSIRRLAWWLTLLCAAGVLLPAPAVHAIRLRNRHASLQVQAAGWLDYGTVLSPALAGEAMIRPGRDELSLRIPAGSTGYLEVRPPSWQSGPWQLPRALYTPHDRRTGEELSWRASIERDHAYFGLVEADRVFVQAVGWGLLVTAPTPTGEPVGHSVALALANGQWEDWTLRRGGRRLALSAGGRELWSMPDPGPFRVLRLGETRTDREHGGTLRLRAFRFARFRL